MNEPMQRPSEDEAALAIALADNCGCTVNGKRVLCDHSDARDSVGRKVDACDCRKSARAVLALFPSPDAGRVREESADLVAAMIEWAPWKDHMWARGALAIAAQAVRRGRHLTGAEKLANLKRALCEDAASPAPQSNEGEVKS